MKVESFGRIGSRGAGAGKGNTKIDQLLDPGGSFAHGELDNVVMTETGACDQGIALMFFEAVGFGPNRGNASLGVAGGSLGAVRFADKRDPRFFSELKSGTQTRDSGAKDQNVLWGTHKYW
jgi:hypothetical protein